MARLIMTKQSVIDGIYKDYRKYGIEKSRIEKAVDFAEQDGFSYSNMNTGIRLSLSRALGVSELFSLEDAAAFCEISVDEVREGIKGGKNIISFMLEYDKEHPTVPKELIELREGEQ